MILTTEELGDLPDVDAATMDELLSSDAFGKFAILSASADAFIQAANEWQPGAACQTFLTANGSDPWVLEYREGGRQFQAPGHLTLERVQQAFRWYLSGAPAWRTGFTWDEVTQ